jgi:menaquinone-9 beta-reductase
MNRFDVLIVGAGPAGSSAAIGLARRGFSVALADRERFPREKLCGDFVNPANWPLFRHLGVEEEILSRDNEKVTRFRLTSFSGEEAEIPLPSAESSTRFGLGLRRSFLDHVLLEKAAAENVAVWQGCQVTALKRQAGGWWVGVEREGGTDQVCARIVVGADGRNSRVAHHLKMVGSARRAARALGFQLRLQASSAINGKVEIHLFPGGYAGLVGLGDRTLNLCLAVEKARFRRYRSLAHLLESCVALNPYLGATLCRSAGIGETRSVSPVYFSPRRSYGDGVLLAGDAARVSEPVTGEGIYFALKSGELAARAVDRAFRKSDFSARQLRSYERECEAAFRRRRNMNALIRWLIYRPALLSPLIGFSTRRTGLLDSIVHAVCQPEPGY